MKTIQLGSTATDIISGFRGVATGRATYLTGCDQYLLSPQLDKDGKQQLSAWFDVQRLKVDDTVAVVKLDNTETPGADLPAPIK